MLRKPIQQSGWWYDPSLLPQLQAWLASWLPRRDWTSELLTAYLAKGFLEEAEWQRLKQGAGGWERFRSLMREIPRHVEGLPRATVVWLGALGFVVESVNDPSSLRLTKGLDQLITIGLVRSLVQALIPERPSPDPDAPLRRVLSEVLAFHRVQEAAFNALSSEQRMRLGRVLLEGEPLAMAVVPPARRDLHRRLQAVLKQAMTAPVPSAARLNEALERLSAPTSAGGRAPHRAD